MVKRMLEQLKTVTETADLPNLPPPNFEQEYTTILEKYALVTLLELYRIQNTLAQALADASAQNIATIFNTIQSIKIYLENNRAFNDLEDAINSFKQEKREEA